MQIIYEVYFVQFDDTAVLSVATSGGDRWRGFIWQEVPEINQQGAAFTDSRGDLRAATHTALY